MPGDPPAAGPAPLEALTTGQPIVFGGDRVTFVPAELAAAFRPGDRMIVVQATGDLLHVPQAEHLAATTAVEDALSAFTRLADCSDEQITDFYERFAAALDDEAMAGPILRANAEDVERVVGRGSFDDPPRALAGDADGDDRGPARLGRDAPGGRDDVVSRIDHDGWSIEAVRAPLGVVGFVFEGRPNVFADAAGVVRTGNTVVFRIGSDALGTARAISEQALTPALAASGLPAGTVRLVPSAARAAGWALFSDPRLALAVARGSGPAVAQLGAVARQAGIPVSLHGTGGAWLVAGIAAGAQRLCAAIINSLDRKVCNTLNVCCIPAARAEELVPVVLDAVDAAAALRGTDARLHVEAGSAHIVPADRFARTVTIRRAGGDRQEPAATLIDGAELGTEWEWEESPELSLVVTDDVDGAIALCNQWSPRFVASLVSDDAVEQARFYARIDAPFVSDGFTRWVDGQYALGEPELGLANWQGGRTLARGAILSGDGVHTIRYRAAIDDPELHR